MQANLSPLAYAASACVGANKAKVYAYAAVIAFVLRDGKSNEKGFTQTLRRNLAREIAISRAGGIDAWEALAEETRDEAKARADATAKRYAEKSIKLAAIAAEKGLELAGVLEATAQKRGAGKNAVTISAEQIASEHVYGWLTAAGVDDQESLTAFAGMATAGGPKGGTKAEAPSAGDGAGEGEDSASDKGNAGETQADPVTQHLAAAIRAAGADLARFAGAFTAALASVPEAERRAIAKLILPVVAEAADLVTAEEAEAAERTERQALAA